MTGYIIEDTRQQRGKHDLKHDWWASHSIKVERRKLDFGDYMTNGSNISVDTKRDIAEIAKNINGREHQRFKNECVRARDAGYRLIILVENREGVHCLRDLVTWVNNHCQCCGEFRKKRCTPDDSLKCAKHGTRKPIQGARLARAMSTMSVRYGVRFEFCTPHESAKRICELLGVRYDTKQDGQSSE